MVTSSPQMIFLDRIVDEIKRADKFHTKKIVSNVNVLKAEYSEEFDTLLEMIYLYFLNLNYQPEKVATDYLMMVRDMRKEGLYFYKNDEYRCKSQSEANDQIYSKPEIMGYYMTALLISQILWKHHFYIFTHFRKKLPDYFNHNDEINILDIGPGHGFFSFFIKDTFPKFKYIDFVDISDTSLSMTKKIIGEGENLNYFLKDIFDFNEDNKYDFIVLGEVLEHLDNPQEILLKLSRLLSDKGILWITTPTNSPALDHVYLFRTKQDVITLIEQCELSVANSVNFFAEDVPEDIALARKVTNLVGLFCRKS